MPIDSALVGAATGVHRHDVDARWTMAYSAALGDTGPHHSTHWKEKAMVTR